MSEEGNAEADVQDTYRKRCLLYMTSDTIIVNVPVSVVWVWLYYIDDDYDVLWESCIALLFSKISKSFFF